MDRDDALLGLADWLRQSGYAFTTVTPATHARVNARPENGRATDARGIFGWSRPFGPGVLPDEAMALMQTAGILHKAQGGWRSTLRFSSIGADLFMHSAFPTTGEDAVFFGPDTYRFVAAIQEHMVRGAPVRRAIDICAGAGPGAVAIGHAHPGAKITMADINPEALRLSCLNAQLAGVGAKAVHSDLLSGVDGAFDLIVANPPYLIDPARRAYRHGGGSLGAGLSEAILDAALDRLTPGGTLLLYTGVAILDGHDPFLAHAAPRLAGLRWEYRERDPDVFGEELDGGVYQAADRIAAVVLTVTKGG